MKVNLHMERYAIIIGGPANNMVMPAAFIADADGGLIETQDGSTYSDCVSLRMHGQFACYQRQANKLIYRGNCKDHDHHD